MNLNDQELYIILRKKRKENYPFKLINIDINIELMLEDSENFMNMYTKSLPIFLSFHNSKLN